MQGMKEKSSGQATAGVGGAAAPLGASADGATRADDATRSGRRPAGMSRRQFVMAGAAGAVLVGVGGLGAFARDTAQTAYLRPPGAEDEAHLLARCDRCQRCVQACPYDLVQPRPLTWDFPAVGTPELIYKDGYCDFCMKCVEACPTGALSWDAPSAANIGVAKVVSDACVAWDWGGCTVCADRCPVEGAITLDDRGRPHVDETICDGCGLCEMVCPAPSLRAYDASTAEKGIYVVSRQSAAAAVPGALTSAELETLRRTRATGADAAAGAAGAGATGAAGAAGSREKGGSRE